MKKWNLFLVLSLIILGCAPTTIRVTKVGELEVLKSTNIEDIALFSEGQSDLPPYQILGKVFAQKIGTTRYDKIDEIDVVELMKKPAAELGANALIGVHSSIYYDYPGWEELGCKRWASGLAVLLNEASHSKSQKSTDIIISILPVIDNLEKGEAYQFSDIAQKIAQYHLERGGYYAPIMGKDVGILKIEDIMTMDTDELNELGGENSSCLLLISVESVQEHKIAYLKTADEEALGKGAETVMKASLINKEKREIIWENTAVGYLVAGWIVANWTDEKKESLFTSMRNLFKSFPPYNLSNGDNN